MEKLRWRTNLLFRKVTGLLPGLTWRYVLGHVLFLTLQARERNNSRLSELILQTDSITTFATPWGQFRLPKPAKQDLDSLLEEIFVNLAYEDRRCAVEKGDVVVDCGAHVGLFARFALQKKAARVVCVEMDDRNFSCLRENLRSESERILTVQSALWSDARTLNFFPSSRSHWHRVSGEGHSAFSKKAFSLDDVLVNSGVTRVDFIKIDVEGAEPEVLQGAMATIRRHRPKLAVAVYHDQSEVSRIRDLFAKHSIPYEFSSKGPVSRDTQILFGRPAKI